MRTGLVGWVIGLGFWGLSTVAFAESPAWDAGFPCSTSAECGCGYVCTANRCVFEGTGASTDTRGVACSADRDCPSERGCVEGYCRFRCGSDRDCRPSCYSTVCVSGLCERGAAMDTGVEPPEASVDTGVTLPDDTGVLFPDRRPVDEAALPPPSDVPVLYDSHAVSVDAGGADVGAGGGTSGGTMPGTTEGGVRCSASPWSNGQAGWLAVLGALSAWAALRRREVARQVARGR